jgi:hypothetical protein
VCDRCALWYNHQNLKWQYDWAGASLINKRILVCDTCYDTPQNQLRAIVLPADPVPIINPRTEPYLWDSTDYRQVSGYNTVDPETGLPVQQGNIRVTSDDDLPTNDKRVVQQTGAASGSNNQLPGTDPNAPNFRFVTNAVDSGNGEIRLTVGNTNGFITGQGVIANSISGVTVANGNWYITVVNQTQIDLNGSTFSGSYTSGGYVINDPSVPRGFNEIPATGPL